jgi:hypothetical protein
MSATDRGGAPFAVRTVLILVVVAVLGFVSFLLLSAYSPDFKLTRNGGAHALSTSAVGFSGAAELVRLTQGKVGLLHREGDLADPHDLLVLTPDAGTDPGEVQKILERRKGLPTLIVLPKWWVAPLQGNPAWVQAITKLPGEAVIGPLKGTADGSIADRTNGLSGITGPYLEAVIPARGSGAVLARIVDTETYVLADPDAISNHSLATREGAERAMTVLTRAMPEGGRIAFDLTLAGFGRNPNLLKLAFEPPFLPLTLCILFAALLAGWHAMRRFGPAEHEGRALAFGKRAIVENGAGLLRLAKRRHRTGGRYAALTREAAAAATGAPTGLSGDALDRYLDRLSREGEPFSSIAGRAEDAPDTRRLLAAARDLYQWKRTVTREH